MREIKCVAVVGGGLIGMSWACLFLARGIKVVMVEPVAENHDKVKNFIDQSWSDLQALSLTCVDEPIYPQIVNDITQLSDIDYVQENTPDRLNVKHSVITALEQVVDADVIIASSTSSLKASDIQQHASHPERILVAHPMNPPHMVPMVELVAGNATSESTLNGAEAFYKKCKRVTIRVNKEVTGHLANRLTSALYREAVYIVEQGIASVEDIDKAIAYGPGMRWALMGPHLTYHLGGGEGGYEHYLDHLGPTQEARWQELGTSKLTADLKKKLVQGVDKELVHQDVDSLATRRDKALVEIAKIKEKYGF